MFEARTYRKTHVNAQLDSFEVGFLETDLWIGVDKGKYNLSMKIFTLEKIKELRSILIGYQNTHKKFMTSFDPLTFDAEAPAIIQKMLKAGIKTNTGPMACVAGVFAYHIGEALKNEFHLCDVIIENGGDNYILNKNIDVIVPINAGKTDISEKIGVKLKPSELPLGICTSSGKFGYSHSFGKADTVTVVSKNIALADAMATSICNTIQVEKDVPLAISRVEKISEIDTCIIIMNNTVGIKGKHEIVFL